MQAAALRGALGMSARSIDDRFLVGLAVLSVLAGLAEDAPLLCLVDDAQWVDQASMDALVFAARRLEADGIALLIAARDDEEPFDAPGLPKLSLDRLDRTSATRLLADHSRGLDVVARDRLLDQAAGSPLALIELSAASTAGRIADEAGTLSVPRRIEQLFRAVVAGLPRSSQNLLLVVAADDTGELDVVLRAARALGASDGDLAATEAARMIELGRGRVAFRHPLIRAATYHGAPTTARWAAHRALADALHGDRNADRRAWHLAASATAPDATVAAALERSAEQARARGGIAAVAAASERAAELSTDQPSRARRLTVAAEAAAEIGRLDRAGALIDQADAIADDPPLRARLARVRGHVDYAKGELDSMHGQLLAGVGPIVADDPQRALWLLMELMFLSYATGDRATAVQTADLLDDLRLPAGDSLLPIQRLLRWFLCQRLGTDTAGLPPLSDTVRAALAVDAGGLRGRLLTVGACLAAGESDQDYEVTDTLVSTIRAQGAIGLLPRALVYLSIVQLQHGRHRDARATSAEAVRMARDTGQHEWVGRASGILAVLAGYEGDEERCHALAQVGLGDGADRPSPVRSAALWALALLDLSRGRADAALTRLEAYACATAAMKPWTVRSVPDLVEAAVYAGQPAHAAAPFVDYEQWAAHTRQPWIEAMILRCRALLASDDDADRHYTAALAKHEPDRPFELARTALLYGEWLRRVRRRTDARAQLRAALQTFERLGTRPWAERARRELRAAGETVAARAPATDPFDRLTPQELQVARLAAAGLSNRAIAAQLFLSPRTVGYHLYKAYPKLGVTSRAELAALALR